MVVNNYKNDYFLFCFWLGAAEGGGGVKGLAVDEENRNKVGKSRAK